MILDFFEFTHIGIIYIGVALFMLVTCEIGYQFGSHARKTRDKEATFSLGPMVGGLLGMLAFVLAFVFSMATSQYDLRKQNVLDEANAIGTAYLRTELLDEQFEAEVKPLLREYVDIRLQAVNGGDLEAIIARSDEIQAMIWAKVTARAKAAPSINTSLVIGSINEMFDMQEKRINAGIYTRIPVSVWMAMFIISALSMITMGTQVGLTGKRRLVAVIPMLMAFAVLITLVVDINRPQNGMIKVGQQAMLDLQASMRNGTK